MAWEIGRVGIAAAAVVFLPGWLLLDLVRWQLPRDVRVSVIPIAFALSVAIVSAMGVVAYVVGANLDIVMYVLIGIDGPLHNVLKIKPPIVFSRGNADFLVEALDGALMETA